MTAVEFAYTVTNMDAEAKTAFFERLKDNLSEEDYNTTVQFISWIGMFRSPAKYKAMRTAICEELFGMEVPLTVKSRWDE